MVDDRRRRVRHNSKLAETQPDDRLYGDWTRAKLEKMNARFIAAVERAFRRGREHRQSAAAEFISTSADRLTSQPVRILEARRRARQYLDQLGV
jgi:hypothetical protein